MIKDHDNNREPERRRTVLTEADFARIGQEFSLSLERIGIDNSTTEARREMHADMDWLRDARQNTASAKKWVFAGLATLLVAAGKGLWGIYTGISAWIAIYGMPK